MSLLPPLSLQATSFRQGIYEHYKGMRYQVLEVARHSETLDEYVVYKALDGERRVWVRPLPMFLETVNIEGRGVIPRFTFVSDQ